MALLSDEEIAAALGHLPGWQQTNGALRRIYEFRDFRAAMQFVHRVADLAEAADHHPSLTVNYRRVTVTMTSHDLNGITERDIRLIHAIDD